MKRVLLNTLIKNITEQVICELTYAVKQDKLKAIDLDIQSLQQKIKQYNSQKAEINSSTNNNTSDNNTTTTTNNTIEKSQKIQALNTKIRKAQDKITQLQKNKAIVSTLVVDK